MNALAPLATSALLGTERRAPDWPMLEGALGTLLSRIPRDSVEKALLQAAGVLGTCQLAGFLPARAGNVPAPATDDALPEDSRIDLLTSILTDGPERLQAEAFIKIAAAGRQLPHRLLPRALECGRRSVALRPSLLRVLGRRGEWLAAQNDSWAYAVGGGSAETLIDDVWQHGSLDQRRLYLVALRERDAAKARELVREAMSTEGAKERTAFIECLATGLTMDDQDLLESTLTDKSKEARQTAARLLSTLPESRFAQRMAAHLASFVKAEKKLLRGTVVTLEAPNAFDAAWKADLIEESKPKGASMGERAWWLFQIVRSVPLSWWEAQTGMNPAECLALAQKSDWKDALLQGWAEAQAAQRRVEWAEAFLGISLPPNGPLTVFDLLETLPPTLRETYFLKLVTDNDAKMIALSTIVDRFIKGLPMDAPMLSPAVAVKAVKILKQRIHSGEARYDWQLRHSLVELACLLPVAAFDDLAKGWELAKEETQPFAEAIARIGIVLDQRKQLQNP
ncbi:MAG TPA: hypothetical protein DIT13_13360 [Verrucomicrobiales bacterium]|nr:hypothetical protein [Verrucomicrobiales bacterium]HRJ08876.1 DUF5691 domain-containing protein [Prosthecobacter sp.]HRK15164.1 DUF5691 domain-containing protein [Prosthecobacter sp.]